MGVTFQKDLILPKNDQAPNGKHNGQPLKFGQENSGWCRIEEDELEE